VSAFIDHARARFGIEPICRTLEVSSSAYYRRATGERSERVVADWRLAARIREMHKQSFECCGYRGCSANSAAKASRSAATG
jgi:hypothetical protein